MEVALNKIGDGPSMAELIDRLDWHNTPLGPRETWSASLRSIVGTLLNAEAQIVLFWGPEFVAIYNDAYAPTIGEKHPNALGCPARDCWSELWDDLGPLLQGVFETGETFFARDRPFYIERFGYGETVYFDVSYSVVPDDDGSVGGVLCIVSETTERIRAEQQLRKSEGRFRALVSATADIIYTMSADLTQMVVLDGQGILPEADAQPRDWKRQFVLEDDWPMVDQAVERALREKSPVELEHRVTRRAGEIGWVQSRTVPILDDSGEVVEWFGAATDVTARRAEQEHLKLVVNELNHRVKNNLAMVQSIAMQSFSRGRSPQEAQDTFNGRIVALGHANDLLTGERWAGASLRGAIEQALEPHMPDAERLTISGPEVKLTPKTALAVALAVHELATNALKYGAWSDEQGQVRIEWRVRPDGGEERLHLRWQEHGGPPVSEPERSGFGSRLVERGLAAEMNGSVNISYAAGGLTCEVEAPLPNMRPD